MSSKTRANKGMVWVLCGLHLVNFPHNTVSKNQQLWKRGRLILCSWLLHCVKLLVRADIISLQEKEKTKCPGAQFYSRVSLKFQVPLPVLENVLWSKIRFLLLPWPLRLPVEKLEIGKLRLTSKGGCRNRDFFVWTSVSRCISLLFRCRFIICCLKLSFRLSLFSFYIYCSLIV